MVTCDNGHYYDADKYANCPYCANGAGADIPTMQTMVAGNGPMEGADTEKTAIYGVAGDGGSEERTVYMGGGSSPGAEAPEEMVSDEPILLAGWLAVISEQGRGTSYTLTFGMNTLGRSEENHVSIQNGDQSISRHKHAMIIYDYENNLFYIKHGEGQFLTYLNGEVLLETKRLHANDRIKLGSTELIFIPLCSENFKWEM
jgi:hypothetical protein